MKTFLFAIFLVLPISCAEKDSAPQLSQSGPDTLQSAATDSASAETQFLSYDRRQGKHLYMKYCAVCHGEQGNGDGFNAFNLEPRPRNLADAPYMSALSDQRLIETVIQGGRGVNKSVLMPSWGGRLTRTETEYVISYVRVLSRMSHEK